VWGEVAVAGRSRRGSELTDGGLLASVRGRGTVVIATVERASGLVERHAGELEVLGEVVAGLDLVAALLEQLAEVTLAGADVEDARRWRRQQREDLRVDVRLEGDALRGGVGLRAR